MYPIFLICMHICKSLSVDCYHWEVKSRFTECISLYIPLQIFMLLSGRIRIFVKNFGVLFFEKSRI